MFVGFLLLVFGGLTAVYPYGAWYLSIGWKFKDAEPSDAALAMQRFTGVIAAIIGLVVLVSSCSTSVGKSSWEGRFKDRLNMEEVVSMGIGVGYESISEDDKELVLRLIRESDMHYQEDTSNGLSFHSSIELTFDDGSRESIYAIGSNQFQINPSEIRETKYIFRNSELMSWLKDQVEPRH